MPTEVSRLLLNISAGNRQAASDLLPLVYDELRRLADLRMRQEQPGQTLQPTALVHEAWLRLVGPEDIDRWDGRGHFFAAAAEAMRRILIDRARARKAIIRGGQSRKLNFDELSCSVAGSDTAADDRLLDLDQALSRLAQINPEAAQVVQLRYFAGLSVEQAAAALNSSERTVKRNWAYARAWLQREIDGADTDSTN